MTKGLRAILKERGMTQAALAEATGLSTAQISLMISGKRGYSRDSLAEIAIALNVQPSELLAFDTPDHAPTGLNEGDAEPFTHAPNREGDAGALFRFLAPSALHPALYAVTRSLPMAALLAGDQLIVDLKAKPTEGDLVLARQVNPETSESFSLVRRWIEPHLISLEPGAPNPIISLDHNINSAWCNINSAWCNIVGPVVAAVRPSVSTVRAKAS